MVMPGTEIVDADEEEAIGLAPVAEASAKRRPLLRRRITAESPAGVGYAGDFEVGSARAAEKRRRQVLMLFWGAVLAIFVGTVLVVISMKAGGPPELPAIPRVKPTSEPVAATVPAPALVVPVPPAPIVRTPAPLPERENTVLVPAPTQPTEPKAVESVPEVVSHYPAVVKLSRGLEFPTVGQGISETFSQEIALPGGEIDPGLEVRRVELELPAVKGDYPGVMTFSGAPAGSLVAGTRPTDRTVATVSWKEGNGEPVEVLAIEFNRQRNAMELRWRSGQMVRQRESVIRAYWVLCTSRLMLDSGGGERGKSQVVAFAPYEPAAFPLETASGAVALPTDLPKETTVVAPDEKDLGHGWEATWFTESDTRGGGGDVVLRSSEKAAQVVKFHQKTATPAAEPWFIVRFSANFQRMENTFATRLAGAQADLAQAESDVRAADVALERIRKDAGGVLPANSENVKLYQSKRADAAALVDAYKSEVDGYNQLTQVDIDLTLPNGVRLTTVRFRRAGKQ